MSHEEQRQHERLELPPTEPIDLPPRYTTGDVDPVGALWRRRRDERIAELVTSAVARGVPSTSADVDLGLELVPVRHGRRRARRAQRSTEAPPMLGIALLLALQGAVGAAAGVLGTLAYLGLSGAL